MPGRKKLAPNTTSTTAGRTRAKTEPQIATILTKLSRSSPSLISLPPKVPMTPTASTFTRPSSPNTDRLKGA